MEETFVGEHDVSNILFCDHWYMEASMGGGGVMDCGVRFSRSLNQNCFGIAETVGMCMSTLQDAGFHALLYISFVR